MWGRVREDWLGRSAGPAGFSSGALRSMAVEATLGILPRACGCGGEYAFRLGPFGDLVQARKRGTSLAIALVSSKVRRV
jgi:hypothetical protein